MKDNFFLQTIGRKLAHGDFIRFRDKHANRRGYIRQIFDDRRNNQVGLRLGVELLLTYRELPVCLQTARRHTRGLINELWLDERQITTVDPEHVESIFECRIEDTEVESADDTPVIREIVYTNSHRPATRPASHRHRLFSEERHKPKPPPRNGMIQCKFFLDLFIDDFGPYRNVYHSLGGVYLVIGNLPLQQRQLIRNIFLLGFIPFGATFEDFISLFTEEMLRLQDGIELNIDSESYWIIAGMRFCD